MHRLLALGMFFLKGNQMAAKMYQNRLSNALIAEGINVARQNAIRLAIDAESMFKLGRYPTSLALSILSIEESGKPAILRQVSTALQDKELKAIWQKFVCHKKKNIMTSFESMFENGARNIQDFIPMHLDTNTSPREVDALKQSALYTQCDEKKKWHSPVSEIDEETAQHYLRVAQSLLPERDVTEKRD